MRHSRPQLLANTYYFQYRSKYKKTLQFFAAITVSRLNRDISIIQCRRVRQWVHRNTARPSPDRNLALKKYASMVGERPRQKHVSMRRANKHPAPAVLAVQ